MRTATFSRDPMTAPTRIWRLPKVPLALTPYVSQLCHWSFSPAAMGAMRTSRPAAEKLGAVRQDPDLDDLLVRLISRATGGRQEHAARAGRPWTTGEGPGLILITRGNEPRNNWSRSSVRPPRPTRPGCRLQLHGGLLHRRRRRDLGLTHIWSRGRRNGGRRHGRSAARPSGLLEADARRGRQ